MRYVGQTWPKMIRNRRYFSLKVQTLGVLLGAVAVPITLWLTVQSINELAHWTRERFTFDLLSRFNDELADHPKAVEEAYPDLMDPAKGSSLSLAEAQILVNAKEGNFLADGKTSRADVRRHLNSILNHTEDIASAWEKKICEQDQVEEETASGIVRWYNFFAKYIQAEDRKAGEQNWPPLMRVVEVWKRKGHGSVANPSPNTEEILLEPQIVLAD